jgi:glycosyltransferase involved in cell wall biosynthesis/spore maturation protein CgeB
MDLPPGQDPLALITGIYVRAKIRLASRIDLPAVMHSPIGRLVVLKNFLVNNIKFMMGKSKTRPVYSYASYRVRRKAEKVKKTRSTGFTLPPDVKGQKDLRIACIMDDFSYKAFAPEANWVPLTATNWHEIESINPHILFVESAWHGKDGSWRGKINIISEELIDLLAWCKEHNVPTVFWSKDDPPHFNTFIMTAGLFDLIFTTDIDKVSSYKSKCKNERVFFLPFPTQPTLMNPMQTVERRDAFSFAGSFYLKYPERQRDMEVFVDTLSELGDIAIFDRNQYPGDQQYSFPDPYRKFLKKSLSHDQIHIAHKGFLFGINMNSIKQSQSMCSRRVQELLSSNTSVLSNYSRGVRNLFGDIVLCTDDKKRLEREVAHLRSDESYRGRIRLAGVRKVFMEYSSLNILTYILNKVYDTSFEMPLPLISVLAKGDDISSLNRLLSQFKEQTYPRKELILMVPEGLMPNVGAVPDIKVISRNEVDADHVTDIAKGSWLAFFSNLDSYGPNYLTDLAVATLYAPGKAIGKNIESEDTVDLMDYRQVEHLPIRSSILTLDLMEGRPVVKLMEGIDGEVTYGPGCITIDHFNYLRDGPAIPERLRERQIVDVGMPLAKLWAIAEGTNAGTKRYVPRSRTLVLAPHYPSYDNLYRYMFVHSRVVQYKKRGELVDVVRYTPHSPLRFYEFENIDVAALPDVELECALREEDLSTIVVHALNEEMWNVLRRNIHNKKVLVWVHGAEIQPWERREFNFQNNKQRKKEIQDSHRRMHFWKGLFSNLPPNLHLVFVSQWFADEVMKDVGVTLPRDRYSIIHNPIDTDLFDFVQKGPEQRKKVLSVRPYASRKYANDLTVQAILDLAARPFFSELEFRLIGDGPLFDATVEPLRKFNNVIIEKRFLRQEDISALHKSYGVFICPTRMDAQGVSRDEAMSSGLVPITNNVTAIPEFVSEDCGFAVPAEDHLALANAIETLYRDEELFLSMSGKAAQRVRGQSGVAQIIDNEMRLIF